MGSRYSGPSSWPWQVTDSLEGNGQMLEIEPDGILIRVKSDDAIMWRGSDGAITMTRVTASRLVTQLDSALRLPEPETEGEDG